jgi:hypothetical protein
MNWLGTIAALFIVCSGTAEAATLTWNANTESDLAGYRVYQCAGQTCSKSTGSILVTLGKVTSFNIGTPVVTQTYFVTAFDSKNNESGSSNVVTYTVSGGGSTTPPPTSPVGSVKLTVVGTPSTGPWGVSATISDTRALSATVRLDGSVHHTENQAPWSFPGDNGVSVTTAKFGNGSHTVEFIFNLQGTTTEVGRASVTVQEGSTTSTPPPTQPPPAPVQAVNLTVVGTPTTGPWGVSAVISDTRALSATVRLDGSVHHTENQAPWSFPGDNGISVTTAKFGTGSHTVEFIFNLRGTTTEVGRASVTVQEGSTASTPPPAPVQVVNLTVVGNPATGPWGIAAEINDQRAVMGKVYFDGAFHHDENLWPYSFPSDNGVTADKGKFGRGTHTVQFVFYLKGTTTEVGRASVTVNEG